MHTVKLNTFLESFDYLSLDEKEYAMNIIKKQIIELKRDKIQKRAKQAKVNFKKKNVKSGNGSDLYNDLEND